MFCSHRPKPRKYITRWPEARKIENMNKSENKNSIFPKGDRAPSDYFTGTAWVKMLVPNEDIFNCQMANVEFEPGCRNNWHTHPGGQILVCTDGNGYFQQRGTPIQLLHKGDIVKILPAVEHWHGATPDSHFTHVAINPNTQKGIVVWLHPVTEEEYNSFQ